MSTREKNLRPKKDRAWHGKRSKATASPYVVWMFIFILLPLLVVVYYAFTTPSGRFTLDNLTGLGGQAHIFLRSLWLAALATFFCLVLAYPISFMLSRMRAGRQQIMLMLVMLPMWMNFLLRTYAWLNIIRDNGILNMVLGWFGLGPFHMANTQGAIMLGMVYNYLPFMILPLYTAMVKIDQSIIEAAEDLGANRRSILFRVLLPLSKPGINTGIIMVFVPSVSTFVISRMLSGGTTLLIGDLIEMSFTGNSPNYQVGSAMSLILMVVVLLCMSVTGGFDSEDIEGVI